MILRYFTRNIFVGPLERFACRVLAVRGKDEKTSGKGKTSQEVAGGHKAGRKKKKKKKEKKKK